MAIRPCRRPVPGVDVVVILKTFIAARVFFCGLRHEKLCCGPVFVLSVVVILIMTCYI